MTVEKLIAEIKEPVLSALMPMQDGWSFARSAVSYMRRKEGRKFHRLMVKLGFTKLSNNSRFVYSKGRYVFKFEPVPYQNEVEANFYDKDPKPFYNGGMKVTFPRFIGSFWDDKLIVTVKAARTTKKSPNNYMPYLEVEMEERFGIGDLWSNNVVLQKTQIVIVDCGYNTRRF